MDTNRETLLELVDGCEVFRDSYEKTDENLARAAELEALGFVQVAKELITKIEHKDKIARIGAFGYILITEEKIKAFLDKKVDLYNESKGAVSTTLAVRDGEDWVEVARGRGIDIESIEYRLGGPTRLRSGFNDLRIEVDVPFGVTNEAVIRELERALGTHLQPRSELSRPSTGLARGTETMRSKGTVDFLKSEGIGSFVWEEERIETYPTIPPSNILETLKTHKARNIFDYFTIASVKGIKDPILLGRVDGSKDRFFIAQWGEDIHVEDVI